MALKIPPPPPPPSPGQPQCVSHKALILHNLLSFGLEANADCTMPRFFTEAVSSTEKRMFIAHRNKTPPMLQDGPQCGLIALCVAARILTGSRLSIESVFQVAKSKGFTIQGEMFFAQNMAVLCEELFDCQAQVLSGPDLRVRMCEALVEGATVLIPYDKDCNHEPCNKGGISAHWATITGFVVEVPNNALVDVPPTEVEEDTELVGLYHAKCIKPLQRIVQASTPGQSAMEEKESSPSIKCDYVFAQQGKSRHCHLWRLDQLLASNAQLLRPDPVCLASPDYVLPVNGDISEGLCGKAVVLRQK